MSRRRTQYGTSHSQWILDSPEHSSSWSSPSASVLARSHNHQAHSGWKDAHESQTGSEAKPGKTPETSMTSISANDVQITRRKTGRELDSLHGPTQGDHSENEEGASAHAAFAENANQLKTYGARKHNQRYRANRDMTQEKQESENIIQGVSNDRLPSGQPPNNHSSRHRDKEAGGIISRDEPEDATIATQSSSDNTLLLKPIAAVPRVVIPAIPTHKRLGVDRSSKEKANSRSNAESPVSHPLFPPQGGQRNVRGRISLSTSSARRNRWHKSSTQASVTVTSAVSPLRRTSDHETGSEWEPDVESEVENRPPPDVFRDRNLPRKPDRTRQHRRPVLRFDATADSPQPHALSKRVNRAVIQSGSESEDEPAPVSLKTKALASHPNFTAPKNSMTANHPQSRATRKRVNRRSATVIQSDSGSDDNRPPTIESTSGLTELDSLPEVAPVSRRIRVPSDQQDDGEPKIARTKTRTRRRLQDTDNSEQEDSIEIVSTRPREIDSQAQAPPVPRRSRVPSSQQDKAEPKKANTKTRSRKKFQDMDKGRKVNLKTGHLSTKELSPEASEQDDSIEIVSSQNQAVVVIPQLSTPKGYPLKSRPAAKPFRQNHSPLPQPYAQPPMAISPVMKIHGIPVALAPPPVRRIRGRLSLATSSARRAQARTFSTGAPATFVPTSPDVTRDFPGVYDLTKTDPPSFELDPSPHRPRQKTFAHPVLYASPRRPGMYLTPVKMKNRSMSDGRLVCSPYVHHPSPAKRAGASRIVQELSSLLQTCGQSVIYEFNSIFNKPPATIFRNLSRYRPLTEGSWMKIAEATFSEVYSWSPEECSDSADKGSKAHEAFVMKVVPIKRSAGHSQRRHATKMADQNYDSRVGIEADEFPCETEWVDVEKEIELARLLGSESEKGFLNFRGAFIVSGAYPPILLKEWKSYQERFPEKVYNPSPEGSAHLIDKANSISLYQLYCCMLSGRAGEDLESFGLRNWQEATSVLSQVAHTLGRAERDHEFEHRDLHWGNITVQRHESNPETRGSGRASNGETATDELVDLMAKTAIKTVTQDPLSSSKTKISVTLLDFGLSRARLQIDENRSHVIWTEPDPDIFGGTAEAVDYQFECYDLMSAARKDKSWSDYNPFSNVIAAERILSDAVKAEIESHRRRAARFLPKRISSNSSTTQVSIRSAESFTDWWDSERADMLD
ncbi:uncharacterized protein MELLADRAFT_64783 [Melampsora larici-populina 98AG31]|uniref:non-specific serine/threonine protein kinase n=1 Tax=Melampsora larici-populina (strain 98AG31 / pathotype 3-4-7) TaxID=747676 RepID=F4RSS7_MELLP|nr:uncharacterized protein MELLADRAFT_64783 [Melampsora larici-populina 98AG31]EGG04556.1 hypothetical protein MELLADRAFT_64783 [Melampsora larici-populina 98AG31]